ncbi:MAG: RNA ligase family protein [Thermoanaerobaculia bacterium]
MTVPLLKYPRTRHLEGSRTQPGDEDLDAARFDEIRGRHLVVEEKLDGANAGISIGDGGELLLQSRGHYLTGGPRERHWDLFKRWAHARAGVFRERLGRRYVVYGEWLYAKHTVFYDRLPHYFMEFDVLDRRTGSFLSTARRHALWDGGPLASVPVLHRGEVRSMQKLWRMIGTSLCKSEHWRQALDDQARAQELDVARVRGETDGSGDMEGLYVKVEEGGGVCARYKLIRASFLTTVVDSGGHWLDRPIVPNRLAEGVDLFGDPG